MDLVNLSGRSGIWRKLMSCSSRVVGGRRSRGLRFALVVVLLAGSVLVSSGGAVSAQDSDPVDPVLVFNFDEAGTAPLALLVLQNHRGVAQSFTTGPRRNGYVFSEVTVQLRGTSARGLNATVKIYDDNGSNSPDTTLHTFPRQTVPAGTTASDYTFSTSEGILLGPGTKYWLVVETSADGWTQLRINAGAGQTSEGSLPGWTIAPQVSLRDSSNSFSVAFNSHTRQPQVYSLAFRMRGVALLDEYFNEFEIPGIDFAPDSSTAGALSPDQNAHGELTRADDARPSGSASGTRWNGDVLRLAGFDQNRRYRVEAVLGFSHDRRSTGGSISVFSVDSRGVNRSHGEFWDHNRDDGRAFVEFTPGRDLGRWRTYYLELEARDGMQTEAVIRQFSLSRNYPNTRVAAAQFFGGYTVSATDITTGERQLVANTSLKCDNDDDPVAAVGHKVGSAATERFAHIQEFTTGPNTGGYRLARVEAFFGEIFASDDPKLVLRNAATSMSVPGLNAPLFNTNRVVSPRSTVRFTSDGSIVLSASTTYRLEFSETKDTGEDYESYDINLYPGGCSYQERDNAAGWSIATSYSQDHEDDTTAVTTGTPTGSSLRIGVYGNPVGGM